MMSLADLETIYKWSRRRRSIGLKVTVEGKLEIHAPRGVSQAKINEAIASHRDWIARKVTERREAWNRLQGGVAFFLGEPYRLTAVADGQEAVELAAGEMKVRAAAGSPALWLQLRQWYRREAEHLIARRVRTYGSAMGLAAGPAQLRQWKGRWGECHSQGGLRFNWRLIMLPPEIVDYVVVHELTHLKVPGHSSKFWQQVAKVMPDYARRRRWLNRYGTPFLLWQPGG